MQRRAIEWFLVLVALGMVLFGAAVTLDLHYRSAEMLILLSLLLGAAAVEQLLLALAWSRVLWRPMVGAAGAFALVAVVASLVTLIVNDDNWLPGGDETLAFLIVGGLCAGAVVPTAALLELVNLPPKLRRLRPVAQGLSLAWLALLLVGLLVEFEGDEDIWAALLVVLGFAALLTTLATPAAARIWQVDRRSSRETVKATLRITCPRCTLEQPIDTGRSRCAQCRLIFHLEVEEPRCPSCNYQLHQLTRPVCPECGHALGVDEVATEAEPEQPTGV